MHLSLNDERATGMDGMRPKGSTSKCEMEWELAISPVSLFTTTTVKAEYLISQAKTFRRRAAFSIH